ncbi:MAG: sulfotransferase domain-containing protein [Alphaproteobacteria bacterium]|nr:sulfotransferase domain-containing protein [Alphaproteobacteria bacterium]
MPVSDSNPQQHPGTGLSPAQPVRLLLACMPKSGSTYLSALIAHLPGMRKAILVPGFDRREQELSEKRLEEETYKEGLMRYLWRTGQLSDPQRPIGYVSQMHLRNSLPTRTLIERHELRVVVQIRDIFDIMVSIRDHLLNESLVSSAAYATEEMKDWPEDRLFGFIADMVMPWYFNFYLGWLEYPDRLTVSYEALLKDRAGTLRAVADYAGIPTSDAEIAAAIEKTEAARTRKNAAIAGRGTAVPETVKQRIRDFAAYYPGVDFSPIGL